MHPIACNIERIIRVVVNYNVERKIILAAGEYDIKIIVIIMRRFEIVPMSAAFLSKICGIIPCDGRIHRLERRIASS